MTRLSNLFFPMFQHLQRVDDEKQQFAAETDVTSADEFQFYLYPFADLVSKILKKSCTDSTFGIEVASDDLSKRAYIRTVVPKKSVSKLFSSLCATRNKRSGCLYIVEIDGNRIFSQ